MPEIFLSYSREDRKTALRYAEALRKEGFDVWWDQTLNAGEAYDEVTEKALEDARAVVVLWSKSSVASRWVRAEATTADRRGTLVPVMVEDCKRPIMFELRQSAELADWKGDTKDPRWRTLADGLRRLADKPVPAGITAVAPRAKKPAWRLPLALGTLLVPVLALAWYLLSPPTVPGPEAGKPEVLVVPFDVSGDAPGSWKPFADDMPREVVNNLRKISGLSVVPWPSALSFKGAKEHEYIRKQLPDVQYVLDGGVSFAPDSNELQVTAQLTELGSGAVIKDMVLRRKIDDPRFFELQSGIAQAVSVALKVAILKDEQRALGEFPTNNPLAYRPYVAGWEQLDLFTYESLKAAVAHFDEAIALDTQFFAAYMGKAEAQRSLFGYFEPPIKMLDTVEASLDQALKIRPGSAEVYASLGLTQVFAWKWEDAWKNLDKARTYGPNLAKTELGFALYYSGLGNAEMVKQSLARAETLDPLNTETADWGNWALFIVGEAEAAKQWIERKMVQHPTNGLIFTGAGVGASIRGDTRLGVELAEKGVKMADRAPIALIMLAQAYGYDGQKDKVQPLLDEADAAKIYTCPYESAAALLSIGQKGRAIKELYRAVDARSNCLMFLRSDPRMHELRDDPAHAGEYRKLLKAVGLDDESLQKYKQ
jgi:TolB-like protein/tetratricopeptide (TPR) repeat protein